MTAPTIIFGSLCVLAIALAAIASFVAPMPVSYAVTVAAFPLGALFAGAVLAVRGRASALRLWFSRLFTGLVGGVLATLCYNLYRVPVSEVIPVPFDPFRVQPVFGQIITGLPSTHPWALAAGWGYHLWLGATAGMIFATLVPRGGVLAGIGFVTVLQIGRWMTYPDVFIAGLSEHEELIANGIFGVIIFGVVLGLIVKHLAAGSQPTRTRGG